jgi:hypothetical protein
MFGLRPAKAMARTRIVAQGTPLVAWRLYALSCSSPRTWRTRFTIIVTLGTSLNCEFPRHTFFEEDCFNGLDDDRNGLVDCEDPVCMQKVACLTSVPNWDGPVAVWHGAGNASPPDCSTAKLGSIGTTDVYYAGELHQTSDASACPPCTCSTGTPRCTSRLTVYPNDRCDDAPRTQVTAYVSSKCSSVAFSSGTPLLNNYSASAEPFILTDACAVPTSQPGTFPDPSAERKVKLCSPAVRDCGEHACVNDPPAPFSSSLCIYAPGSVSCPTPYDGSAELLYVPVDGRQCSPCSCTASGLSCPPDAPVIGDYGNSYDCTGSQRFAIPSSNPCIRVNAPMLSSLNFVLLRSSAPEPTGNLYCAPSQRKVDGSVSKASVMTLCCMAPLSGR